jgi:hypothetical protein
VEEAENNNNRIFAKEINAWVIIKLDKMDSDQEQKIKQFLQQGHNILKTPKPNL